MPKRIHLFCSKQGENSKKIWEKYMKGNINNTNGKKEPLK